TVGHRLQLQRDIGHNPDHGNYRDEAAQPLALAVSRSDEIGDGSDAIDLADSDDLQHHEPPKPSHQGGAKVNGQETDPRGSGAPHAAVERPGRTIDSERK